MHMFFLFFKMFYSENADSMPTASDIPVTIVYNVTFRVTEGIEWSDNLQIKDTVEFNQTLVTLNELVCF